MTTVDGPETLVSDKDKKETATPVKNEEAAKASFAATDTAVKKTAVPPVEGKRVLRPLRAWADILDEIKSSDIVRWISLNSASAYTDGNGNAIIRFDSDFQRSRAEESLSADDLSQTVSAHIGQAVRVVFETSPSQGGEGDSIIDEILDNLEEDSK